MGASASSPEQNRPAKGASGLGTKRVFEVCVLRPSWPRPRGPDGQVLNLYTVLRTIGEEEGRDFVMPWDQPIMVQTMAEAPRMKVQVLAASAVEAIHQGNAFHFSEVCIPYLGHGCLQEMGVRVGGSQVELRLSLIHGARVQSMTLEEQRRDFLRAVSGNPPDASHIVVLLKECPAQQPQAPVPAPPPAVASSQQVGMPSSRSTHSASQDRSLEEVLRENAHLQSKVDETRYQLASMKERASIAARAAQGLDASEAGLENMRRELASAQDQQQQIQAAYDERVADLQDQRAELERVRAEGLPGSGVQLDARVIEKQAIVEEITIRRDALMRQWRGAVAEKQSIDKAELSSDPDIVMLQAKTKQYEAELAELQRELSSASEKEDRNAAKQMLGQEADTLREQFQELKQVTEDEHVRSEYEVREVKKERDMAKDRLEEALRERQCVLARKEALEHYKDDHGPSKEELQQLHTEHERFCEELSLLQQLGEARKQEIAMLENDQMKQIEEANLALVGPQTRTGGSVPNSGNLDVPYGIDVTVTSAEEASTMVTLQAEADALEKVLHSKQESCQAAEAITSSLRLQVATLQEERRSRSSPASVA